MYFVSSVQDDKFQVHTHPPNIAVCVCVVTSILSIASKMINLFTIFRPIIAVIIIFTNVCFNLWTMTALYEYC